MSAKDFTDFHSLVEQFQSEMSIKSICDQEGVSYRRYITWRKRMGLSKRRKQKELPVVAEVEITDLPVTPQNAGMANVRIEFENGLVLDRHEMDVDKLIEFLNKIKPVLCLN